MLCLSRDLRAFLRVLGRSSERWRRLEPAARLCRDLVRRQLFAEAGRQEPLGARAAAFSSELPRAQHRCGPPLLASFGDIAPRVRPRAPKRKWALRTRRAAISSSSAVPPLQTVPNDYSRFVLDAEMMPLAVKKPGCGPKPEQSWRVLRFFGPNTERSDALVPPLDGCYTPPGLREGDD